MKISVLVNPAAVLSLLDEGERINKEDLTRLQDAAKGAGIDLNPNPTSLLQAATEDEDGNGIKQLMLMKAKKEIEANLRDIDGQRKLIKATENLVTVEFTL